MSQRSAIRTLRLDGIDALRGIAALSVCWFHLTNGNVEFLPPGWLRSSGEYGWLGVEVFFVISGFIIPYALSRTDYSISQYGRFLLKRIVRLDPPYLASIAIVIGLGYVSAGLPGYRGAPPVLSAAQIALHFGYLNVFFDYPWLNSVFWTLAIEIQYYLFVGLAFPLIAARARTLRYAAATGMIAVSFVGSQQFLPHWFPIFLLGIAAFQYRNGITGVTEFIITMMVLSVVIANGFGIVIAVVTLSVGTFLAAAAGRSFRPLRRLGVISYSLYLVHIPVGGRVINLGERLTADQHLRILFLFFALLCSLGAASLLYAVVERPAQGWASRIRYLSPSSSADAVLSPERLAGVV